MPDAGDKAVIAHRGACGYLPEHTLAAYAMAHAQGADFLEPDVVATADGVLIARHDVTLEDTTDIAEVFPDRARDDGHWYAADFRLAELRRVQARERLAGRFRQDSAGFPVPTLVELVQMLAELNRLTGRRAGIYPELKAPAFHRAEGLAMEEALLELLHGHGYHTRDCPAIIQCFEPESLRYLREGLGCGLRLMQLIADGPPAADSEPTVTPDGLDAIAAYAEVIGPAKSLIESAPGEPVADNALVRGAHERGLAVHPFTFRADQLPAGETSLDNELSRFYFDYGVDAAFVDHPDRAVALLARRRRD